MDAFCSTLQSFQVNGKARWNGCILSNKIPSIIGDNEASEVKQLDEIFSSVSGASLHKIVSYVCAKNIEEDDIAKDGLGNPLLYEDDLPSVAEDTVPANDVALKHCDLVNLSTARQFLSLLLLSLGNDLIDSSSILPMLIFCNGDVNKKGIYCLIIFCNKEDQPSPKLNSVDSDVVSVQTITCSGPFSGKFCKQQMEKDIYNTSRGGVDSFMSRLLFQPHIFLKKDRVSLPTPTIEYFAHYQLFGGSNSFLKSSNVESQIATLSLDVACDKMCDVLQINPHHIVSMQANLAPVPGDVRSPVYKMYEDILILKGFLNAFGPEKEVKWAQHEESDETIGSSKDIGSEINELIAVFNGQNVAMTAQKQQKDVIDEELLNLTIVREELDFTEQIWELLKQVGDFKILFKALCIVMKEIEKGTTFWLHETSNSMLADLITASYTNRVKIPDLSGLLPIQIIIEIGLDKLQRDYFTFFIDHHLTTASKLHQFVAVSSDDDDVEKMRKRFNGIQKLHHVVEVAAYCYTFLQFPMRKIRKILRSILYSYCDEDVDFNKVFSFPVSYKDVQALIDDSHPMMWRMSAKLKLENQKTKASACWSRQFPFLNLIESPADESLNQSIMDKMEENEVDYYLTTVTTSQYAL